MLCARASLCRVWTELVTDKKLIQIKTSYKISYVKTMSEADNGSVFS